jgi:hypothetical protein
VKYLMEMTRDRPGRQMHARGNVPVRETGRGERGDAFLLAG